MPLERVDYDPFGDDGGGAPSGGTIDRALRYGEIAPDEVIPPKVQRKRDTVRLAMLNNELAPETQPEVRQALQTEIAATSKSLGTSAPADTGLVKVNYDPFAQSDKGLQKVSYDPFAAPANAKAPRPAVADNSASPAFDEFGQLRADAMAAPAAAELPRAAEMGRPVEAPEALQRAIASGLHQANVTARMPVAGFGMALDYLNSLFGHTSDYAQQQFERMRQSEEAAQPYKPQRGEDFGPLQQGIYQATEGLPSLGVQIAQGGPAGLGVAAERSALPIGLKVAEGMRGPAATIIENARAPVLTATPIGTTSAEERYQQLVNGGVPPEKAAILATFAGVSSQAQMAAPLSVGSEASTLLARIASRAAQGAGASVATSAGMREMTNELADLLRVDPRFKQQPEAADYVADALVGMVLGQGGHHASSERAPSRVDLGYDERSPQPAPAASVEAPAGTSPTETIVPAARAAQEAKWAENAVEPAPTMEVAAKRAATLTRETNEQHRARLINGDWNVVKEPPAEASNARAVEGETARAEAAPDATAEPAKEATGEAPKAEEAPAVDAIGEARDAQEAWLKTKGYDSIADVPQDKREELLRAWKRENPVDQAAHDAAASPLNEKPEPTKPQILAGNAELGHPKIAGMDISVENPAESVREDKHNTPPQWSTTMQDHYGYIRNTVGFDKDHLDVFVKPGTPEDFSGTVYVVNQQKPGGRFDEHKAVLGASSMEEAREIYLRNYGPGWESHIRSIVPMSMSDFKNWAYSKADTYGPKAGPAPTLTPADFRAAGYDSLTPHDQRAVDAVVQLLEKETHRVDATSVDSDVQTHSEDGTRGNGRPVAARETGGAQALPSASDSHVARSESDLALGRGEPASRVPLSKGEVADAVTPLVSRWKNAPEVKVHESMDSGTVPRDVRDLDKAQLAQGASGRPAAFFHDGAVHLVASEIHSPHEAIEYTMHEALGHYGLRGAFGDKLDSVLLQITDARRVEVAAKAKEYGLDPLTREGRLAAAEEVLAGMAQKDPRLGFVQRAVSAVRNWLRERGINLKWTDADIIQKFILPARAWVEKGAPRPTESKPALVRTGAEDQPRLDRAMQRMDQMVALWEKGNLGADDSTHIGETPRALQLLGAPKTNLYINGAVINKVLGKAGGGKHGHQITPEMVRQIPAQLHEPMMVFAPESAELRAKGALVVVTELKDRTGKPVLVPIHVNKDQGRLVANEIASVYGHEGGVSKLEEMAKDGLLLYADKGKTATDPSTTSRSLPAGAQTSPPGRLLHVVQLGVAANPNVRFDTDVVKKYGAMFARTDGDVAEKPATGERQLPGRLLDATKNVGSKLFEDLQLKVAPMAAGSDRARAVAKDYAEAERVARWQWNQFDKRLEREFTPADRKLMWEAADEESVLRQQGEDTKGKGLDRLSDKQRAAVEQMHEYADELLRQAKEVGLFHGEGLPYWTPRMVADISADGEITSPRSAGSGGSSAAYTSPTGRNITTSAASLRHREHLTAAETEAAAKAKFGDQVQLVRDIRTMPLAMARLERAIAGRQLINEIKAIGDHTGQELVSHGDKPGFFTVDSPAFKTYRPRFSEENGKHVVVKDEAGNVVMDKVPLYVSREFEGPLKAIMTDKPGVVYKALMELKAKATGLIMYSPLIHNAVEWGRALPLMPGKVLTLQVYFEGNRAKHDPETMRELIHAGMVPIGDRFGKQDISGIVEEPNLNPGRSWTAKALAAPIGLVSEKGATAVKRAVDTAGDVWHNKLLWDRVADLQAGLAVNMRDSLIKKGFDRQTAVRMAAHFANRYAGALPNEAMSAMARKAANLALFSRTFTLGNLGVMKDMITGLPKDVQAQIARDAGEVARYAAVSESRKIAIHAFALDIILMYAMNSALQSAFDYMLRDKSLDKITKGYVDRFSRLVHRVHDEPTELLKPFGLLDQLSATSENEPGKGDRIRVGSDKRGTATYLRMPVGKIGEEFKGWATSPLEMLRKKEGTISRPIMQTLTNDRGFGRQVYDPDAPGFKGAAKNVGRILWNFASQQVPADSIEAAVDMARGRADETAPLKVLGPLAGVTFSKGAPGGPAVGELLTAERHHREEIQRVMPDVRQLLKDGDTDGARAKMREEAHMTPREINTVLKKEDRPDSRLSSRRMRAFERTADEEAKDRMRRFREERSTSEDQPQDQDR